MVDKQEKILGILLAVIQKEHKGFLGIFSARSIIFGGPLIKDDNIDVLDYLLNAYNKRIEGKVVYSQFRNQWEWNDKHKDIFAKHRFDYEEHLDIIHDISLPVNELFMKIHKGRRKNIRRAERNNIEFSEIKNEIELHHAFDLIKETYKGVRLPLPDESLFKSSFEIFSEKDYIKVFIAKIQGETIATRIVLCFNYLIYDWYAGSSYKYREKYPNDYLPWKVIEWVANNGYKYFDFGGAGKPNVPYGVRDYKMKFGGELVEYGRYKKIHKKLLMKIGELGLTIYKLIK
ncbi:hypothetical protein ES705_22206 [subsurface metagenome]